MSIPFNDKNLKILDNNVKQIYDRKDSYEFRQPVDYILLGLDDYPQIIKYPIDLGTIRQKIQNKEYTSIEQGIQDLRQVWINCKLYNADYSKIHKLACKLESICEKLIQEQFFQQKPIMIEEKRKEINYNDKLKFAEKVENLSQVQLNSFVKMIQKNCPQAFVKLNSEDYQIIVDQIPLDEFTELKSYLDKVVKK